jgi:deoxyhypusine synthase
VPNRIRKLDRSKLRTYSARARSSKVGVENEAVPHSPGAKFADFLDRLPKVLGASDLRAVVQAWDAAWARDKTVLFGFGAHLIKVGLAPVVVDLMERGAINTLMMNGAGCVHDIELAMFGRTSEDVASSLDAGGFGMARDTADALNAAIVSGAEAGLGMGASIGRAIDAAGYPHADRSVLCAAHRLGVPVTVHAAIGTDIHHMHASADGAALGATSFTDFETLAGIVAGLQGGVVFNVGSAVILPEVFLKALSIARNLGHRVDRFTSVNLDFMRQYRPETNVVDRPTRSGGRGYSLLGQHEILVPLLAAGVIEAQAERAKAERAGKPKATRKQAAKQRSKASRKRGRGR